MPALPFSGYPGSAHYQVHRDTLRLRYRFPWMEAFKTVASEFRVSRGEKRTFLEWARKFLTSGGQVEQGWLPTPEEDRLELARLDETLELAEAVRRYLVDCERGNAWLAKKAPATLSTVTRPMLERFCHSLGASRPLSRVTQRQISDFVRALGGRKETKERHLCPISNLFEWALREGFLSGKNPAHGIVFWREDDERPHDGVRKSYSAEQFSTLVAAAATDPLALDAILLGRYLALRLQDALELRWEDFLWDKLLVAVRRRKTRSVGVEVSHVDLHPALIERYRDRRGHHGFCLVHQGVRSHTVWPTDDALRQKVAASNYSAVGRELGVSGVAVKKRLARASSAPTDLDRTGLASTIGQKVERITRAAGLYERGIQPYYVLRHTFACDNIRAGVTPAIVALEMGISLQTLMKHYFHAIPRGDLDDRRTNRWNVEASAVS